jgi:lipoprotein-anchoring transpeptidase ErfK/SrfK
MQAVSLLKRAQTAAKTGQEQQAHQLLKQAVRQEPDNHLVWLWLAKTSSSPQASLEYVKRAERLMPEDALVKKARAWAERRVAANGSASSQEPPTPSTAVTRRPWSSALKRRGPILLAALLLIGGGIIIWSLVRGAAPAASKETRPESTPAIAAADEGAEIRLAADPPVAQPTATATPVPTAAPVLAKKVSGRSGDPRPTWTPTPLPTDTPTPTPTPLPTFVSAEWHKPEGRPLGVGPEERWIDVDLSEQTLYVYEGNGLIFETLISSGLPGHETVSGQFRIWYRTASQTMDGARLGYDYYLENVPYVMYFFEDYALHGTYWHNNFGWPMSHGCVNMRTEDAGWVFEWARVGTLVNVHQ